MEDEDDEGTDQGQQSKDDEPGWVIGTITKTVRQLWERICRKQMKLDGMTQRRCEDATDRSCACVEMYGTSS